MTCVHLRRLYQLCEDEDIKISGSDLLQIVCTQCGVKETCPSMLVDEFESGKDGASPNPPSESRPAE